MEKGDEEMPDLWNEHVKEEAKIVLEKINKELKTLEMLKIKKELLESDRLKLSTEVNLLKEEIEDTKEASEFIQSNLNAFNEKYLERIRLLINKALKYIFYDQNYEIVIELENKKINFLLKDHIKDGLTKPLSKVGGGIRIVVSVFLQVFFIMERNMERLILQDESLYAVSEIYRERFYSFMKMNSKENNFYIIAISHDDRTERYMDDIISINE